ncbi:pentapeptide repeat-containing protein [Nannocystis punicea]|uniref:Pentapeptide repeat-containing protein n=1 Tax=Nannocystis punicea TaxID=2995304 RepID=A0ABY7GXM9_9BACT|nr:pentapeptide repeat-containing protein [Nannocystis poenicansa]WAS91736.1 pentapeptide repeat-containing protein [Nannocystis poenicansa]
MTLRRDYGASRFNAPGEFTAIGFSSDSRSLHALVLGQNASRWLTFAVDTGAVTARRELDDEWRSLGVLPDGGLVVDKWGAVRRLSADGEAVWTVSDTERLRLGAVSPCGAWLVTFEDAQAELRDVRSGAVVRRLPAEDGDLYAFAFSRDGRTLATGSAKGIVRLHDVRSGDELGKRKSTKVLALAFSPTAGHLLVGHGNGKVELWQLPDLKPVRGIGGRHEFPPPGGDAGCRWVAVSPDGARGFSLGNERALRAWSLAGGGPQFALDVPQRHAQGAVTALSPDGRWLATGSTTGALSVWSADAGAPLVEDAAPAPIAGLALTPRVVAAASSRTCVAWDRATGRATAIATASSPTDLRGLSSGRLVRLDYQSIFVGDALESTDSEAFELSEYASGSLALSRDEKLLAVPTQYHVELWDLARSVRIAALPHANRTRAAAFGPRDAWLVTADESLHLWRLGGAPTPIRDIPIDNGRANKYVHGLAVSGRGLVAVSVGVDENHYYPECSLLIVDPRGGETLARLPRPGVRLGQVAFVGGARLVVTDSAGRLLRVDLTDPARARWLDSDDDDAWTPHCHEALPLAILGDDVAHVGPGGNIIVRTLGPAEPEVGEPILLEPDPAEASRRAEPTPTFEQRLAGARFLFAGRFKTTGADFRESTVKELGGEVASKPDARVTHLAIGEKPSATVTATLAAKGAKFETLSETALAALLLPTPDEARALLRGEVQDAAARWNAWRKRYVEVRGEDFPTALQGIDLSGLDLHEYQLKVLDFTAANLAGAKLKGVDLFDTVFRNADLTGADLTGCNGFRTIFSGAKLNGARLGGRFASARFDGAVLADADLRDAELQYANFSGADLRGALLPKQLRDVKHDARTRWPDGTRP